MFPPRFSDLQVDIVGPLIQSEGFRYLLTVVCRTTRYVEAIPLRNATSAECCQAFIDHWMRHFGLPEKISSDNGNTFQSRLWQDLHQQLGIIVSFAPLYSPSTVGTIERQHADIKNSLRAVLLAMGEEHGESWARILPWVLLGRRTSYHADLGATPAQLVFGSDPKVPGDLVHPVGTETGPQELLQRVKEVVVRPPAQTALHKQTNIYLPPAAKEATHVWAKNTKSGPLEAKWDGPFKILERLGQTSLKIQVGEYVDGQPRVEIRHWRSCQPAPAPEIEVSRPALGRPKAKRDESTELQRSGVARNFEEREIGDENQASLLPRPNGGPDSAPSSPRARVHTRGGTETEGLTLRRSTRHRRPRTEWQIDNNI